MQIKITKHDARNSNHISAFFLSHGRRDAARRRRHLLTSYNHVYSRRIRVDAVFSVAREHSGVGDPRSDDRQLSARVADEERPPVSAAASAADDVFVVVFIFVIVAAMATGGCQCDATASPFDSQSMRFRWVSCRVTDERQIETSRCILLRPWRVDDCRRFCGNSTSKNSVKQ